MLHIGFLNLSTHMALLKISAHDPFLSTHLHPIKTGSPRRITQGILKGWLDGGILPLPLALVLAQRHKEISLLAAIKNRESAIVTPGAFSSTPFQSLKGKRILFSCLGSMEYLLIHRLFRELGLSLSPSADPNGIIAEEMPLNLISDALESSPHESIGAAVLEEPALSRMLEQEKVSSLISCHDLWPEHTGAVLVARNTGEPERKALLKRVAQHLTSPSKKTATSPDALTCTSVCRAHFLATNRYLKNQRLFPLIDTLIK